MPTPASSGSPAAPPAPLDAEGRLHALDILRGLALFGMILVHFHQKMRLEATGLEDLIGWGVYVLVEQKSWGTFAFLFGVGFAVLLRRLEARGEPVVPIYLRRLIGLAVFGVIAQVGFGFTILFQYAMWGLVLLLVRKLSSRALIALAVLAACAQPVLALATALHQWSTGSAPTPGTDAALYAAVEAAAQGTSYLTLLSARWDLFLGQVTSWRTLVPDTNLALFLVGLLAVRHRVVDEPKRHTRLIAGWMTFGFLAWGLSWLLPLVLPEIPIPGAGWPLAMGLGILRDQWLCFTYIGAALLLLAYRPVWTARLRSVGLAGRMALTNYLLQAIVLDALSSGYGAGLKLRPAIYPFTAVLLFAAEAAASTAWLGRYRFGPLEWIWRTFTYARPQPLRRLPAAAPAAAGP